MKETGLVVETEGNTAKVLFEKTDACKSCDICSALDGGSMYMEAENTVGAKAGERVEMEVNAPPLIVSAFALYIVPVIALISGYAVAERISHIEIAGIIGGALLFFVSLFMVKLYGRKMAKKEKFRARIVKIVSEKT